MRSFASLLFAAILVASAPASAGTEPQVQIAASELPPAFHNFRRDDFTITVAKIPMRDGVKLHTVILHPKNAAGLLPILLEHTPYDASEAVTGSDWMGARSPSMAVTLGGWSEPFVREGFIFVYQDVRGKAGSEGNYVMYPVPRQPDAASTSTDASTDIYDTIDWLVKNVPGNNGRVATWGTSYPGRTAAEALLLPHPALKAVVPFNPVVDLWIGDDFYQQGAFRLGYNPDFIWAQSLESWSTFPYGTRDTYPWFRDAGPAAAYEERWFERSIDMWANLIKHPTYDAWWQSQALDRLVAAAPASGVAVLNVHSWFDQEDLYGAPALYAAREKTADAGSNYFVSGPWYHAQWVRRGDTLGALRWDADTAGQFREDVLLPFLRRALKPGSEDAPPAEATVFETGGNRWRRYAAWPPKEVKPVALFLAAGNVLGFAEPRAGARSTSFVSDPDKPVPYRSRPIAPAYGPDSTWNEWLVDDQRFADGRPDVLTFVTPPLESDMLLLGAPVARLKASTTGSDADWVVKLIDVYPDEYPADLKMGGYQLMVSGAIMRGRYHRGFDRPEPLKPGRMTDFTVSLPQMNHRFRKGHRIMVQIQSSWFPLYDRNPQTYVASIHAARPEDHRSATHSIFHAPGAASRIELMLLEDAR